MGPVYNMWIPYSQCFTGTECRHVVYVVVGFTTAYSTVEQWINRYFMADVAYG